MRGRRGAPSWWQLPSPSACRKALQNSQKKKGATGITTVAPLVAGQWGRGDNRLPDNSEAPKWFLGPRNFFGIFRTRLSDLPGKNRCLNGPRCSRDRHGARDKRHVTDFQGHFCFAGRLADAWRRAIACQAGQEFAGRFQAVSEPAGLEVNRTGKADRDANVPAAGAPTRTISLKVDSLTDTSVLVRIPVAKEARNLPPPAATKPATRKPDRKMRWPASRRQRADRGGQAAAAGPLRDLKFPSGPVTSHAIRVNAGS